MPRPKPRVESLEGLRAIAIIGIMLYHLAVPWLPSGNMGVVMFLVLSGYLVTCSILKALRREGAASLPHLWLRRLTRVWPSMALMIVVTVLACVLFNHILLTKLKPDLIPSLLLANNIGAILRGASYFDNLGGTSPLTHLWYLGVDFQFFLVWSGLLCALCPGGRINRRARITALVLALISAILMGVMYDPNSDPTRVYYGPDTRAFAPLLGAWLALAWPLGGRAQRLDSARHTVRSAPLVLIGPIALAAIVAIMVFIPATSPLLYRGGMLLAALLSTLLLAGALETDTPLARGLSARPLTWIGERSFGIYLWHFPLFELFKVTQSATSPVFVLLAIALSIGLAELSLRFVDKVVAQGQVPFIPQQTGNRRGAQPDYLAWIPAGALALVLAGAVTGLAIVPDETAVPADAIKSTGEGVAKARDLSKVKRNATTDGEEDDDSESSSSNSSKSTKSKSSSDEIPDGPIMLKASKKSIKDGLYTPFIVSDSVAGDADWCFAERMPDYYLDSYVGRLPTQAIPVLEGYLDQGVVGDIVVLATFSNMPATDDQMDELVELCDDREVFLVNARTLDVECEQINETIDRCAKRHNNVHVIDWHDLAVDEDDWFYTDGEHLTPDGQPEYVDFIAHEIAEAFVENGGTAESLRDAKRSGYEGAGGSKVVDPTADSSDDSSA